MPARSSYPEGAPCWADLIAPDLDAAKRFYTAVMGWQYEDNGADHGHYTMCLARGGKPVAALMPPPPGMEGMPPVWNVYFATPDVGATLMRVETAGGKPAMGPQPVPGAGTMGFAVDPQGAAFGLWQAEQHLGAALWAEPGALCWNQLDTTAGQEADDFYRAVFGYADQQQIGDGTQFDYSVWNVAGEQPAQVAGRWKVPAGQLPAGGPAWSAFFTVADCDKAAASTAELGGKVLQGPDESPYGRTAMISDPSGALLRISALPERAPGA